MRVLVTGVSGHVGSAIAAHLTSRGYEVIGVSRRPFSGLAGHLQCDLADREFVETTGYTIPRCEAVVHAAASLDKQVEAIELSSTNAVGTHQLLVLARRWEVTRFVYISGVPVIGKPLAHPIREDHPTNPLTVYHASKLYGEHLVRLAAAGCETVASLRLPSPIGPGTPGNRIVAVFVQRAKAGLPLELLGTGGRKQNYVDVRDVGRAVESALTRSARGVFHIPGTTVSNFELARTCSQLFGGRSEVRLTGRPDPEDGDVWDVSGELAAAVLDYHRKVLLESSLRDMGSE